MIPYINLARQLPFVTDYDPVKDLYILELRDRRHFGEPSAKPIMDEEWMGWSHGIVIPADSDLWLGNPRFGFTRYYLPREPELVRPELTFLVGKVVGTYESEIAQWVAKDLFPTRLHLLRARRVHQIVSEDSEAILEYLIKSGNEKMVHEIPVFPMNWLKSRQRSSGTESARYPS